MFRNCEVVLKNITISSFFYEIVSLVSEPSPWIGGMGDHSTKIEEMRRTMDVVVGSVTELVRIVDFKVTQAMDEIKKMIASMSTG